MIIVKGLFWSLNIISLIDIKILLFSLGLIDYFEKNNADLMIKSLVSFLLWSSFILFY
jgi:hypothetical protein